MGLNSSVPYAFSFLSGILFPKWALENENDESMGIGKACYYGLIFCFGSLITGIALMRLDHARKNQDLPEANNSDQAAVERPDESKKFSWSMISEFEYGYWLSAFDSSLTFAIHFTLTALGQKILIGDY